MASLTSVEELHRHWEEVHNDNTATVSYVLCGHYIGNGPTSIAFMTPLSNKDYGSLNRLPAVQSCNFDLYNKAKPS